MMNELILGWKWSDRMGFGDAVQKFGWVLCRPAGYTWSHYHTCPGNSGRETAVSHPLAAWQEECEGSRASVFAGLAYPTELECSSFPPVLAGTSPAQFWGQKSTCLWRGGAHRERSTRMCFLVWYFCYLQGTVNQF